MKMNAEVLGDKADKGDVDQVFDMDPDKAMSLTIDEIQSRAWTAPERC